MGLVLPHAVARVYIDTQFSIYVIERNLTFARVCDTLMAECSAASVFIHTSELAIHEAIIHPLRNHDAGLQRDYELYFSSGRINLAPVTRSVLTDAASIRAENHRVRAPDAIHLATAALLKCDLIITNDRAWAHFTTRPTIILSELLRSRPDLG